MKKVFYVVLAQLCILAAWQVLAHSGAGGLTVPAPASVIRVYLQPRFASAALSLRARDREGCSGWSRCRHSAGNRNRVGCLWRSSAPARA